MANWMASAVKPSHRGVFKAKAARAGKTTAEYAREKAGAPGRLGAQARLAETFAKFRPKKKRGMREHLASLKAAGHFGQKAAL